MKRHLFYIFLCAGLLLSSCMAEQTNPLILNGTCADGMMNQNEEAIDCGGVCSQCEIIEPVVAPCKASLNENVIAIDGSRMPLTDEEYICSQESEYFELYILKNNKVIVIEIYETTLPKTGTLYPLTNWFSSEPGFASIRLTDFFNYNTYTGELYLSYENDQWVVEVCSAELVGSEQHTAVFSGRIVCDW